MAKKRDYNKELAEIFEHTAELLEINSVPHKPLAYRRAAKTLREMHDNVADVYKKEGLKGLDAIPRVGKSISTKIEEYITKKKIKEYEELKEKTALREIVTHFFETKGRSLRWLKMSAKRQKIVYGRYAAPAKQLLELAGSPAKAKEAITKVAEWATSRGLDYTIETVFKKWLELEDLKPKKIEKKAFYRNMPMVWNEQKHKWFVVTPEGEWLEFADKEEKIEWRIVK